MRAERALAVLAIVLALASLAVKAQRRPHRGGDLSLICGSARALSDRGNPYDRATLDRYSQVPAIPITYPPLAIRALSPACGVVPYAVIWTVLALAALVILREIVPTPTLTLTAAVFAGFGVFEWTMLTGNPSIVELPVMAMAFWALARSRPWIFGAAVGVLAFLKLAPVAYLASAVARFRLAGVVAASAVTILVAGALHGASAWSAPHVAGPYWRAVLTGFDGFIDAERLEGGERHPALISLAHDLGALLPGGPVVVGVVLAGTALAAVWALVLAWRRRASGDGLDTAAVILLLVAIATPRLKPYAFAALVPALVVLLPRLDRGRRLVALAATCVAPTLALAATALLVPRGALHPEILSKVLFGYMPLYAAMLLVVLAVAPPRPSSNPR
jgi:hypothetical protein